MRIRDQSNPRSEIEEQRAITDYPHLLPRREMWIIELTVGRSRDKSNPTCEIASVGVKMCEIKDQFQVRE